MPPLQTPAKTQIRRILEICVESLDRAMAAERGGANRIELCADLSCGGITPSVSLMRAVRAQVGIPIHVLIRPRAGDFFYSDPEFETMQNEIRVARDLGMDGIVIGVLDGTRQVDQLRNRVLVKLAEPLPVTFHRAFDSCPNLANALQAVIDTGATRLLTSGGKPRATEGLSNLADLVEQAGERIVIMPGGSIRAGNVQRILRETDAREIHSALTTAHESANAKPGVPRNGADASAGLEQVGFEPVGFESVEFEPRVREMRDLIATLNPNPLDDEALPG